MSTFKIELKSLLRLTWPLLLAQITQILMGVSDTIMAGRYSYEDMAAVAVGSSIIMPVLFFIQGISLALSPIVSRLHGAAGGDLQSTQYKPDIALATQQSIWLTLSISCIALAMIPAMPLLFSYLAMEPQVKTVAVQYVQFVLACAPAFAVYQSLRNCCEGVSLTRPTMVIMVTGLCVNIPANYVLINGIGPFPQLGGVGCGVATMLVFYVMAFATFAYCKYAPKMRPYALFSALHKPTKVLQKQQFTLGLPIALTIVFEVSLFSIVALMLAPLGAQVVAAHQIALSFSSLMFMFPMSIGIAVAIRIGYFLGQQRSDEAKMVVYCGLACALVIATLTASISIIASYPIAALYTGNETVIVMASGLLFYAALFQFSDGIQVVSANALRGYKDTGAMFAISFLSYWLIGLPVGIVLGLSDIVMPAIGATGFWIGFISGLSCAAVLMFSRFWIIQKRAKANPQAFA